MLKEVNQVKGSVLISRHLFVFFFLFKLFLFDIIIMIIGLVIFMNNRAQALVEFVLITPIIVLLVLSVVDFGNIYLNKMKLESTLNDVVLLYENKEYDDINSLVNSNDYVVSYNQQSNLTEINLSKKIKINTPFLNIILGNDYSINCKRVIYNE